VKLFEILTEIFNSEEQKIIDAVNMKYKDRDDTILAKASTNPNFVVIPSRKMQNSHTGKPNKCETNTWEYIKDIITKTPDIKDKIFPVAGYQVTYGGSLVEHWWIYNKILDQHYETCPFLPSELLGYIGIINYDINDDIVNSSEVWDIDFFKGGNPYTWYFK
jgi:hypothetical protein